MENRSLKNIVYNLPSDLSSQISSASTEALSLEYDNSEYSSSSSVLYRKPPIKLSYIESPNKSNISERERSILTILEFYKLKNCFRKVSKPISKFDCEGYIYAYYSKSKPGIFKVGRSKNLPYRRIESQEAHNHEKYTNKQSFHCCFHHLIESLIHLELKEQRVYLNKKQDGYTEWFKIEWEPLQKVIKAVISSVMEIFYEDLLLFP